MQNNSENIRLMIKIAHLYYESKLSQREIADIVHLSRPTVCRLINQAEERGYVKTVIVDPFESIDNLEKRMLETFHLRDIRIISAVNSDTRSVKHLLGKTAAGYLASVLKPHDILGVSWGTTLYEMSSALPELPLENITIVELNGFIYENILNEFVFEAVRTIGSKLHARVHYLYVPAFTVSTEVKNAFLTDKNIRSILECGNKSNIAVFGLGYPHRSSMIYRNGYMDEATLIRLYNKGVVGEIGSRFYDSMGNIADQQIDDRTIGIALEELRGKEYSICVAGGKNKVAGILGALRSRYMNVLITDEETAREILSMHEIETNPASKKQSMKRKEELA